MKVYGSIANIMICLFMISILHKSFAYEEYELDAKNNKLTIDLNVNININGSKTKEKPSGTLFFTILYINDVRFNVTVVSYYIFYMPRGMEALFYSSHFIFI